MCFREAPAEVSGGDALTVSAARRHSVGRTNNRPSPGGWKARLTREVRRWAQRSEGGRKEAGDKRLLLHAHAG